MPITELRVKGLRTLEDVRLRLDGLTVLIGENGSGKSSLIEACELLRRAAGPQFLDEFHNIHGGLSLLRHGAPRLALGVTATIGDQTVAYDFSLVPQGAFAVIESESLRMAGAAGLIEILRREGATITIFDREGQPERQLQLDLPRQRSLIGPQQALRHPTLTDLLKLTTAHPLESPPFQLKRLTDVLESLQIHLPFEVLPAWAARALDRRSALRGAVPFAPAEQLAKLGTNLANAYHSLRNDFGPAHWQETLGLVRLGLGPRIEDITTAPSGGGGESWLRVKLAGRDEQLFSAQLSDGMLAYLAFVALYRLAEQRPPSLLALDEPDLHLHPELLMRLLDLFESLAARTPILLATHSDRLLDGLSDPARSVVLCELGERDATRLVRPDPEALKRWLARYRGLGDLRSEGYQGEVMTVHEGPS